jgi:hypothetical protein
VVASFSIEVLTRPATASIMLPTTSIL